MDPQTLVGKEVGLNSSQGLIRRIVVAVVGEILLVTRPEELENARKEGRSPVSVGFRLRDLVQI